MELRYALAVVAPAGAGTGREVALGLARAGAAVLVVDPDPAAADATAALLAPARTRAWTLQADVRDPDEAALVARRARDLGGADIVVDLTEGGSGLAALLLADAAVRRGARSAQPVAVVRAEASTTATEVLARLRRA
ncbi:SDR family NAD(P)-dependent oxidoreductase [Nocardioides marmoraquaticus]